MSEQPFEANILSRLRAGFKRRFDAEPRIFRAPGRVNLIGEHTDYNDGFVLPAAIDLYTWAAFAPRRDHFLHVFSENLQESATIDLQADSPQPKDHWSDYVQGVARMLQNRGIGIAGADIELFSNVPSGAGLSSSAALEVSIASGLLALSGESLKRRAGWHHGSIRVLLWQRRPCDSTGLQVFGISTAAFAQRCGHDYLQHHGQAWPLRRRVQ
jgi:galactokinase